MPEAEVHNEGAPAGEDEQQLILRMVVEGKITPEEGVRLLETLAGQVEPRRGSQSEGGGFMGAGARFRDSLTRRGVFQGDGPWEVEVDAPNGRLRLMGSTGPGWETTIVTKVRARDEQAAREKGSDLVKVDAGDRHLRISSPRVFGSGWATDVLLRLPPGLYDVQGITANGNIEVRDLRCREIRLRTSNGRIGVEEVRAEEVEMETANGAITAGIAARQLLATTSNGSIRVRPLAVERDTYQLSTSNGSIVVTCEDQEAGYRIDAASSWGKIKIDLPDLKQVTHQRASGHSVVRVASPGFASRQRQLDIRARTSAGSVIVAGAEAAPHDSLTGRD